MSTETNKAVVSKLLDLITSGETDAAFELVDDGVEWAVPAPSINAVMTKEVVRGRLKAMQEAARGTFRIWPLIMTAEGARVAVEAESHANFDNGKEYNNKYHFAFVVKEGRIIKVSEYFDSAQVIEVVFSTTSRMASANPLVQVGC